MLATLRRLAYNSLVYGIGGTLSQFAGFLLVPIYTHLLTPEDYGIMAVIGTSAAIVKIVFECGFGGCAARYFHDYTIEERKRFFGSVVLAQLVATGVLTLIIVALAGGASRGLLGRPDRALYIQLAAVRIYLALIALVPGVIFRMREQVGLAAGTSLVSALTDIALSLFFVVGLRMGLLGVYLGGLCSAALSGLLYGYFLVREIRFVIEWPSVRKALIFGLPLIPHLLATWTLNFSDRMFLQHFTTTTETGLYSLGYNFGMIMFFVVSTINTAWVPYFYQLNREQGVDAARALIARLLTYYTVVVGLFALVLAVFGGDLLRLMAAESFWRAAQLVPIVVAAYFIHGLYYMMVNGIYYADQTRLLPLVTGVAAAVNFGANILLIPRIGMMGAAWATLVALAVMAVLTFVLAQRVYPIPFETGRIGRVLAVYLLIWGFCHAVAVASVPWSAIARVAAVLAAPALLAMTGFLRPEERSRLWAALPRIRKGR